MAVYGIDPIAVLVTDIWASIIDNEGTVSGASSQTILFRDFLEISALTDSNSLLHNLSLKWFYILILNIFWIGIHSVEKWK